MYKYFNYLLQFGQAPAPEVAILNAAVLIDSSAMKQSAGVVSSFISSLVECHVLGANWNRPQYPPSLLKALGLRFDSQTAIFLRSSLLMLRSAAYLVNKFSSSAAETAVGVDMGVGDGWGVGSGEAVGVGVGVGMGDGDGEALGEGTSVGEVEGEGVGSASAVSSTSSARRLSVRAKTELSLRSERGVSSGEGSGERDGSASGNIDSNV